MTTCSLRLVPEVLSFDDPDLPPQLRAQLVLRKARVPQIARYLSANPKSYVLSAIIASVDSLVKRRVRSSMTSGWSSTSGTLRAFGVVAGELVTGDSEGWQKRLMSLVSLDWTRTNPLWEGRAIHSGRTSKSSPSLTLTGNVLRQRLRLEISPTNRAFEERMPEERRVCA